MSDLDDDMLEVFVQESREHLDSLEPDLLAMEENPSDMDTINRIFRSVHSLKGTSGFFGLDNISKLAHTMENLMSLARDGEIVLTSPMLDALLQGTDQLRQMVDDPAGSAEADISANVSKIEPFLGGQHTPPPVSVVEAKPEPVAEPEPKPAAPATAAPTGTQAREEDSQIPEMLNAFTLDPEAFQRAKDNNERIYVLTLSNNLDIKDKNRTPLDCFNEIESLGEFLDYFTDISPIEGLTDALDADLIFQFLFTAAMEPDLVAGAFDINPDKIKGIENSVVDYVVTQSAPIPPVFEMDKQPLEPAAPVEQVPAAPAKPAAPAAKKAAAKKAAPPAKAGGPTAPAPQRKRPEETIRVAVSVLDDLMTLAGEMVLGRNQLVRLTGEAAEEITGLNSVLQNINVVTSDLQEKVMQTRLQPIGTILGKFNRIIRDLGAKLAKEIDLEVTGQDVELDRSILEAISDPLTHLIRNCADHAIETPDEREENGKGRRGLVRIIARHAGGQVHVEIVDDGRGIDPARLRSKAVEKGLMTEEEATALSDRQAQAIIFMPGFSSAEEVSDVSGRGVGMDVVRTNIENLGGTVELDSTVGKGTRIGLKLPLTLAIVPAMIVGTGNARFAVPQINLEEVVSLDSGHKIELVRGSPVLRLRNRLLPLVELRELLGITNEVPSLKQELIDELKDDEAEERQISTSNKYIMVLKSDKNRYGLIVEELNNIEEIVVKPLSKYLQTLKFYSGATILGDGKVALILDTPGVSEMAQISFADAQIEEEQAAALADEDAKRDSESQSLLIFKNSEKERFAINLAMVARIEKIETSNIEKIGDREYIKYLGGSLRLIRLHDYMPIAHPDTDPQHLHIIVPNLVSQPIGIVATEVVDAIESSVALDPNSITGEGILGSALIDDKLTLFVDVYNVFERADPDNYEHLQVDDDIGKKKVLLAEDTAFFRAIISQYVSSLVGTLDVATNGSEAWEMLQKSDYDLLLTDIEMPIMNGYELTERVRADERLKELPVIALTSLSADRHIKKGYDVGIDAYETKLDKENLRQTLETVLVGKQGRKGLPMPGEEVIKAEPVT